MMQRTDARQLANSHWYEILEAAGIDGDSLDGNHHPCPLCGGVDRFRFDDQEGRGTYYCYGCGAGDGFKLLMGFKSFAFKDAADFVRRVLGEGERTPPPAATPKAHKPPEGPSDGQRRIEDLRRAWDKGRPVLYGDTAWRYLTQVRKLPIAQMPSSLRFHPRLAYSVKVKHPDGSVGFKVVGYFPAVLAKVVDAAGKAVTIHRTYLSDSGKKAPVENPKKLMRGLPLNGGAIRLMPQKEVLGVAEGIETAFAAHALTGIPTWATISAKIMEGFQPPKGVTTVIIFADNDSPDEKGRRAGQDAAKVLKERLEAQGLKVKVMMPCKAGTDFHDVWIGHLAKREAARQRA